MACTYSCLLMCVFMSSIIIGELEALPLVDYYVKKSDLFLVGFICELDGGVKWVGP